MAGIFAVIPKIVFATNRSDLFSIKQDALFNAISLTNIASLLAWDENNTQTLSILSTETNTTPCDSSTHLRVGGFLGENNRNCNDDYSASSIGSDEGSDYLLYDDIDDFNASVIDVNLGTKTKYKIYTEVNYIDDNIFNNITDHVMSIALDDDVLSNSSNIKRFKAVVSYVGGRGKDKNISSFYYYSTNIGQITLNSEEW